MNAGQSMGATALLRDAYGRLGWRLVAWLLILPVAGLLEGFSLALLFPLLAQFGIGGSGGKNPLAEAVRGALDLLGVPPDLGSLLILIVAVLELQVLAVLARGWLESDCQNRYLRDWQERLFAAFLAADWTHSMRERSAAQVNAIISETGRLSAALNLLLEIIVCAVMAVIYAALSLASAWQVVAFLSVFGAAIYLATRPLTRRGARVGEQLGQSAEELQHATQEFLLSMKLIKATATEPVAVGLFGEVIDRFRHAGFQAALHPKIVLAIYTGLGFVLLGAGVWLAVGTLALDPAAIVVSIYVFLRLYMQISNLQGFRQSLAITLPALPVVADLLDRARAAAEPVHGGELLSGRGAVAIEARDLEMRYGDHVALSGVTQTLPAGSIVGVTGPSGAGKSTLVDAVVGLIRPAVGEIRVDGRPLDALDIPSWRRSIGYVSQDTLLFRGSVAQNIAWGHDGVDLAAIRAAARMAHADDFISALPQGYDAPIGDRGVRLSGGQRQRLGLARALLGEKRLLILDEATSALDSESEAKVLEAVASLRGRVTMLIVAHRLSTLRLADRILVFSAGRLTEAGSFAELVSQNGHFARLWRLQSEAAAPVDAALEPAAK
jgi:ATP-binding cassette subfamily C protein